MVSNSLQKRFGMTVFFFSVHLEVHWHTQPAGSHRHTQRRYPSEARSWTRQTRISQSHLHIDRTRGISRENRDLSESQQTSRHHPSNIQTIYPLPNGITLNRTFLSFFYSTQLHSIKIFFPNTPSTFSHWNFIQVWEIFMKKKSLNSSNGKWWRFLSDSIEQVNLLEKQFLIWSDHLVIIPIIASIEDLINKRILFMSISFR